MGKGIRTAARDALLSDEANHATKGKVFGFHRAMDTLGAVAGPFLALLYLNFFPEDYSRLFLIAFVPGLLAVVASMFLRQNNQQLQHKERSVAFFSFIGYWKTSPLPYRRLVAGLLAFACINSSDVFLLLKVKEAGLDDTTAISMYIGYNLVYALFSMPLGVLADKIGLKKRFIIGLVLFMFVYLGMGFSTRLYDFAILFCLYGIYAAATEGVSKAWISNVVDREDTTTAIGTYASYQSVCAMAASALAGIVWYQFGPEVLFVVTSGVTLLIILLHSLQVGLL